MSTAVDIVSGGLLLLAVSFVLLASIGLHRFDDVFSRIHASTKAVTLGVVLAAFGAAMQMDTTGDVAKLLLAAGLQLVGAPVAAHTLNRGSYWTGGELSPDTEIDHLGESGLEQ